MSIIGNPAQIKPMVNFSAGALEDIGCVRPEHRTYPTNPSVRNLVVQSKADQI